MKVVLLGAPGAGKGTAAVYIKEEFNIVHIATGDIFRYHLRENTELGKKAKAFIEKGELVPDDLTNTLVIDRLNQKDCEGGYLLDGWPRNLVQARALNEYLENKNEKLDACVLIDVPKDILIDRILGRLMCKKCGASFHEKNNPPKVMNTCDYCGSELYKREDDTEETVLKRIEVFERETSPLVDFYEKKNSLIRIDGKKSLLEVKQDVISALKEI